MWRFTFSISCFYFSILFILLFSLTLLSFLDICPWSHYRLSAVGVQVELMHSKMVVWCLLGKQNLLAPLCLSGMQIMSPCQAGLAKRTHWVEAVASGPATICLGSLSLWMLRVMHRGDRVIFLLYLHCAPFSQISLLLADAKPDQPEGHSWRDN